MTRRYRRRKNKGLNYFLVIILLFLIGILAYKIYVDSTTKINPTDNKETKEESKKNDNSNNKTNTNNSDDKKNDTVEVKPSTVTEKSNTDEKKETTNEQNRRGGQVTLELIGEEQVTVSLGSKYKDAGVKARYSDGTNAIDEVEVDNAVDTSKAGTYTVSYYAGNAVVIRRVTVE